jgi:hypothetical protein
VETLPFPTQFTQWKPTLSRCPQRKILSNPVLSNRIVAGFDYSGISVSVTGIQAAPHWSSTLSIRPKICRTAAKAISPIKITPPDVSSQTQFRAIPTQQATPSIPVPHPERSCAEKATA